MTVSGVVRSRAAAIWSAAFWASCCAAGLAGAAFCRSDIQDRMGLVQESDWIPSEGDRRDDETGVDWGMRSLRDNRLPGAALRRRSGLHFAFAIGFATLFILCARGSRIGYLPEEGSLVFSRLIAGAALGLALHWPSYVPNTWAIAFPAWPDFDARDVWIVGEVLLVAVAALLIGAWRSDSSPGAATLSDVAFVGAYAAAKAAWMSGMHLNGLETACPYATCFSSRPAGWAATVLVCVTCVRLARRSPRASVLFAAIPAFLLSWASGAFIQLSWHRTYCGYEDWRLPGEIVPAAVCLIMALTRILAVRRCDAAQPPLPTPSV